MSILIPGAGLFIGQPYHRELLRTANRLIKSSDYAIAAVTAYMACEIATEQAFTVFWRTLGLTKLEPAVDDLLPSYSLTNGKVRRLYAILTGDHIEKADFWPRLSALSKLRNEAVHGGRKVTEQEAQEALSVATQLINHLSGVRDRLVRQQSENHTSAGTGAG